MLPVGYEWDRDLSGNFKNVVHYQIHWKESLIALVKERALSHAQDAGSGFHARNVAEEGQIQPVKIPAFWNLQFSRWNELQP